MADLVVTSIGVNGFQWYIQNLGFLWDTDQYSSAYVTCNGITSSPVFPPSPPGSSYTTSWGSLSGLSAGTSYTAYGYVVTPSGTYASGSYSFTTATPPDTTPPTLGVFYATSGGTTSNSIQVYCSGFDSGSGVSGFYFKISSDGGSTWFNTTTQYSSTSAYATFVGLNPNTTYTLGVQIFDVAGNWSSTFTIVTTTLSARPSNFEWTYPKDAGSDLKVTKSEWDSLQSKINEFRAYKSLGSYSFTPVTIGSFADSPAVLSPIISAINEMTPPVSTPAQPVVGVTNYDSIFLNRIRDSLNSL